MNIKDMLVVARADVIITSHGLHMFAILKYLTNIKFIDVWHAISFKGWSASGLRFLRSYDAVWCSSEYYEDLYVERYLVDKAKVFTTGYARTDQLIDGSLKKSAIIKKYKIPKANQYVLIAPTWAQDVKGRALLPFDMGAKEFFRDLDIVAGNNGSHIIFRTHLNSGDAVNVPNLEHTSFMPYSKYEVVEDFLFIADILVSDWSSVSIDYLPLKRPTLFLDVPAPYNHPFNIDPKYRFGDIIKSYDELKTQIDHYLKNPADFKKLHNNDVSNAIKVCYGTTLDGKSLERYKDRLDHLLSR